MFWVILVKHSPNQIPVFSCTLAGSGFVSFSSFSTGLSSSLGEPEGVAVGVTEGVVSLGGAGAGAFLGEDIEARGESCGVLSSSGVTDRDFGFSSGSGVLSFVGSTLNIINTGF